MGKGYVEELVATHSEEDRVLLDGAVIQPAQAEAHPLAIVWVHGLTGRFYGQTQLRIGRYLAERGVTFVTGNNRGHDFGIVLRTAPDGTRHFGGGGWEQFRESPRDVGAWVGFAAERGFRHVVLVGHSLGALKVAYYQAQRQDLRVAGLVAASPPSAAGRLQPELVAQAERMVAEGRGQDLLPWGVTRAGAGTLSAQTYLDRARTNVDVYGFHTPDPVVAKIRCPLLAFYGTDEAWVGTAAELETIRRNARAAARVDTRLFEGADHSYAGHETEVAAALLEWAVSLEKR